MRPLHIYIENFLCHASTELDLSNFNSIVILGLKNGNDNNSIGAGKSTIFRAIEFCVFNECDKGVKLEKLVRDGQNKCKVIYDFESEGQIYRISRSRTRKGATDLSLYQRNLYIEDGVNPHAHALPPDEFKKFWEPITGRTSSNTEEMLQKIHKINYDAFCSCYYFIQHDYKSGLANATKTERKAIIKNSLQLVVYSALLKLANVRKASLLKELDKQKILLNSIGNPAAELYALDLECVDLNNLIHAKHDEADVIKKELSIVSNEHLALQSKHKKLFEQLDVLIQSKKDIATKYVKAENAVVDSTNKRKIVIASAKSITSELEEYKKSKEELSKIDVSIISSIKDKIENNKRVIAEKSGLINLYKSELVKLRIPLPDDSFCKHCRQPLTDVHRRECEKSNDEQIKEKEGNINLFTKEIGVLNTSNKTEIENLNKLENTTKKLEEIANQITVKTKELADKKDLYIEYNNILTKNKSDFDEILIEKNKIEEDLNNSSSGELEILQRQIAEKETIFRNKTQEILVIQNIINSKNNRKAVIEHLIIEKKKDIQKKEDIKKEITVLEENNLSLEDIIEAFGPTGIVNLIIQDLLDDLQIEANSILEKILPGLQLSFLIEKTRSDGQLDDDLDIDYFLNGKPRDYGLLSGGQKLCVLFSLKLGMAYLIKKAIGSSIGFLLMDEIDQSLDKASVDLLYDIIKYFQKDFIIFVITHNDRMKEKFNKAILVEQDQDMISTAKLIEF